MEGAICFLLFGIIALCISILCNYSYYLRLFQFIDYGEEPEIMPMKLSGYVEAVFNRDEFIFGSGEKVLQLNGNNFHLTYITTGLEKLMKFKCAVM